MAPRIILITGASGGIGAAIARRLFKATDGIILHGFQNGRALEELQRLAEEVGTEVKTFLGDLSQQSTRDRLVSDACDWRGVVPRLVINNAGVDVLTGENAKRSFSEKLELLWRMDVVATIDLSRQFGVRMRQSTLAEPTGDRLPATDSATDDPVGLDFDRPQIINIGWDQAEVGMEGDSGEMFTTVKAAIMAFSKSLAKSLSPHVRVNCIAPGWIRTKWGEQSSEYWESRAVHESLLRRWGTPNDIAAAVAFLASPESAFINGQVIPVNGGFLGSQPNPL